MQSHNNINQGCSLTFVPAEATVFMETHGNFNNKYFNKLWMSHPPAALQLSDKTTSHDNKLKIDKLVKVLAYEVC
jgi:hypothetical protein